MGELAVAAQVPVSVEIYDGMQHVFQAYTNAPESKVSLTRLGQFIRQRTPDTTQGMEFAKAAAAPAADAG